MKPDVLYISYDGMLEPLGQSQVLAYLERLAADHRIHLISFEKPADLADQPRLAAMRARIAAAGLIWHPLTYHKRPSALATAWDIAAGIALGTWLVWRHRLAIVHARSYVAAVMALMLRRLSKARFVFDMRGFWADERVDGGIWPRGGRLYRVAKGFERRFLLAADHVVSLTHAAVREMRHFDYLVERQPPFTVIPTCADLDRFCPPRQPLRHEGFVLGYVGSAGTWYLFDQVVAAFARLRQVRPDARLLVVNRGEHDFIRAALRHADVSGQCLELTSAEHGQVPALIARMDAGVFFIRQAFSKQASAPTKLAEFLGCGVPCLANAGVGDMAQILRDEQVGVALEDFSTEALERGLDALLALVADPTTSARCVAAAQRHFSLTEGVARYRAVWQSVLTQAPKAASS